MQWGTSSKFIDVKGVAARYEGGASAFDDCARADTILQWIVDAESDLMGDVPSLRKSLDEIITESVQAGDPGRLDRVRALIARKVLDRYRNPEGVTQVSQTLGEMSHSRTFGRGQTSAPSGRPAGSGQFTAGELDSVRLRKRRGRFGIAEVAPWRVGG